VTINLFHQDLIFLTISTGRFVLTDYDCVKLFLAVYNFSKSRMFFSILFCKLYKCHFIIKFWTLDSSIFTFMARAKLYSRVSWFEIRDERRGDSLCASASNRPVGHKLSWVRGGRIERTENVRERNVWLSRGDRQSIRWRRPRRRPMRRSPPLPWL